MLIPSLTPIRRKRIPSLSRRVNANSQPGRMTDLIIAKLIKKGEC